MEANVETTLDMAKVTTKGQITIPKAIRQILGVGTGDKVLFYDLGDGSVAMRSARLGALRDLRSAFEGAAEEAGIDDENDVVELVREMRREKAGR